MPANFIPDRITDLRGDVNVASPADQEQLVYQNSSGKWINMSLPAVQSGQSDPVTGLYNGLLFLNTSDLELKFYYGGNWYSLLSFSADTLSLLAMETGDIFLFENDEDVLALDPL